MIVQRCLMAAALAGSLAANAAHIVTQTRHGDSIVGQTHTYANGAGDLRIDERGMRAQAVSSSAAGSAGDIPAPTFEPGDVRDTVIYQTRGRAILSLEGNACRKISASTKPSGMFGELAGQAKGLNEQFADAMRQANTAMAEAMAEARKEGMTPEQEQAMRQFTQPFLEAPAAANARHTLRKLDQSVTVAGYRAEGYEVLDPSGEVVQRLWMAPARKIPGARDVRKGMQGMVDAYREFAENLGAGGMMDAAMIAVFEDDALADKYPVRTEDLKTGETTDIVDVRSGSTEFYPDCDEKNMFGL